MYIDSSACILLGTDEVDFFNFEPGAMLAYGYKGDDFMQAGLSDCSVTMYGGRGDDTFVGSSYDDYIFGGRGDDIIDGYLGADTLKGGKGHDIFYVTKDDTVVDFNPHQDTLVYV